MKEIDKKEYERLKCIKELWDNYKINENQITEEDAIKIDKMYDLQIKELKEEIKNTKEKAEDIKEKISKIEEYLKKK